MSELLSLLHSVEGMMLAIIIVSSGIGIGAALVQVVSILRRGARDAVTSNGVWGLLVIYAGGASYLLWQTHANPVLAAVAAALAVSSCLSFLVSLRARRLLAEVAQQRRQELSGAGDASLQGAAQGLRERLRTARRQRAGMSGPAA